MNDRMQVLEEGAELQVDFTKIRKIAQGEAEVVPVAVQHADTGEVILVAYANREAMERAVKERTAIFWSTSRNELWEKGKTSGQTFDLVALHVNCEQNSLLYKVRPRAGGICHTKNRRGSPRNCYYRSLDFDTGLLKNLDP